MLRHNVASGTATDRRDVALANSIIADLERMRPTPVGMSQRSGASASPEPAATKADPVIELCHRWWQARTATRAAFKIHGDSGNPDDAPTMDEAKAASDREEEAVKAIEATAPTSHAGVAAVLAVAAQISADISATDAGVVTEIRLLRIAAQAAGRLA
jgi:hypothetical protein